MFETVKELMKSEKQKDSEWQTGKTLYEEANERLAQAIQNMNFNEAAVVQGLLEVVEKKMENAMDQSKQCSNKRSELDESTPNMCLPRRERTVSECEKTCYCNYQNTPKEMH